MKKQESPLIAIVTVTKNDFKGVALTNQSILKQSYRNWIHLIIDGNSNTRTLNKIKELISEKCILFSEPDMGIYDAMNKGWVRTPVNSWILFLNGGDTLLNTNSLKYLAECVKKESNTDLFIAPFEQFDDTSKVWTTKLVSEPSVVNQLFCWGYASHQSMLVKRTLFEKLNGFDLSYRVAADWDFYIRALNMSTATKIERPFSRFLTGGFSSQNIVIAHRELVLLRKRYINFNFSKRFWSVMWEIAFATSSSSRSLDAKVLKLFFIPLRSLISVLGFLTNRFSRISKSLVSFFRSIFAIKSIPKTEKKHSFELFLTFGVKIILLILINIYSILHLLTKPLYLAIQSFKKLSMISRYRFQLKVLKKLELKPIFTRSLS